MSAARVTSVSLEVLRNVASKARVSGFSVEVLRPDQPALRHDVTAVSVQVAHDDVGNFALRASQIGVESVTGGAGPLSMTQEGVEVIWEGVDCDPILVFYRVRVRLAGAEDDLVVLTSLPSGPESVLIREPRIDASRIDPLTGETSIGACVIELADAAAGSCFAGDPTDRIFTKTLADENGHSQLLGAQVFVSATTNPEPTSEDDWIPYWAGYLTAVRFVDAITVELSCAHTTRDDETTMVWATLTNTLFEDAGNLAGGPTATEWPSSKPDYQLQRNYGAWYAKCTAVGTHFVEFDIDENKSALGNRSGIGGSFPPRDIAPYLKDRGLFKLSNNDTQRNVFKWFRRNVQPYFAQGAPGPAEQAEWESINTYGWYPGLVCRMFVGINPVARIYPVMASEPVLDASNLTDPRIEFDTVSADLGGKFRVWWPASGGFEQPAINAEIQFYVFAIYTSEASPLLVRGHPVDLITYLWQQQGYEWDAASALATKNALGNFVLALRITAPMSLKDAQRMLCGAFGFGWRFGSDNKRYLFTTRVRPPVTGTLTLDDLRSDNGEVWETEESSRVFSVSYEWQRFATWPGQEDGKSADRSVDGLVAYNVGPIVFQTTDLGTKPYGSRDQSYKVPGSVYILEDGDTPNDYTLDDHTDVTARLAEPVLAQYGRGAILTTVDVGPNIAIREGEDWYLDLPHRPGFDAEASPVAQRGLLERAQVIAREVHPWGTRVTLIRVPEPEGSEPGGGSGGGGGISPPQPNVRVTKTLELNFTFPTPAISGTGEPVDESDLNTTIGALGGRVSFFLIASDPTYFNDLGVIFDIDTYVGPGTPEGDVGTRYQFQWDGLTPIEIGPYNTGSRVWWRVRPSTRDVVLDWSDWDFVDLAAAFAVYDGALPNVSLAPDGSWNIDAEVVAPVGTVNIYVAASTTTYPDVSTVLSQTPTPGTVASLPNIVSALDEGETAYVTAIAEDIFGNRSIISTTFFTRPGGSGGGGGSDSTARALAHHALFLHHKVI